MNRNLPLPPYGKILLAYQEEKIPRSDPIYIFVGKNSKQTAYQHKVEGYLCTYLPYGDDYQHYKWPIYDQSIVIQDTGLSSVNMLKQMSAYLFKKYIPRQIMFRYEGITVENFIILRKGENDE